ncbi:PLP-dependent aminotransferase family protein [Halobacillus aidingensis]|uniref:DNA-binding transcriptional regulator, MocR family, contains an aminotransferase domain n=1 Tax=Halobacillus aidingensis TaxID=240303 RepID=A0A1H0G202_HALAD|nr:PLP-dependent aminotransferase family protein [Halobacillus aidingensis]SDO00948.1 DNA-binding transcriptional regulator, MocR family, contains an aminotransferase domain [Halobacillus aidingensis]
MPINSFDQYPMSWKPEKSSLKRPIYLSLADLLEKDIVRGHLTPGTKLPPQRELADFLDINFTTITRAYKLCEKKGLIFAITGKGTFISPNAARTITISKEAGYSDIDLAFGATFEQTNFMVVDTIQEVASKKSVEELLNYDHPAGLPHHKTAAIKWLKPLNIEASTNQLAIVSGAQSALAISLSSLFEPGNRIVTDFFTYANFIQLAQMYHIQLIPIQADADGMSAGDLDKICSKTNIHGVFLMPSGCNPTAHMISDHRKKELAEVIKKHRLILIEDEINALFIAEELDDYKQPMFNLLPEQTVYINSTSKTICSGLRVAHIIFGESLSKKIVEGIYNINTKPSSLDIEVVSQLILTGKAHSIFKQKKSLLKEANEIYNSYFPISNEYENPLSYFRWLPIHSKAPGLQVEEEIKKKQVYVFHSDRFISGGQTSDKKYLRISMAATNSFEELKEGLDRLKIHLGHLD